MKTEPSNPKGSAVPGPLPIAADSEALAARHFRLGWLHLFLFLSLGVLLEALHGFKVGGYLNPSNSTRRLLWTLAHAHGTLLGLIHIAFAVTVPRLTAWPARSRRMASTALVAGSWLLPAGFFLGGIGVFGGDPGIGIFLVPPGAFLLLIAVGLTYRAAGAKG